MFFDTAELNTSSETYFDSLVKVIEPVRKVMHRKCQEQSSSLNVDLQSQLDLVPIELLQLINPLQDGIDLNDKGYSKEALAISQTIMYNFRYNTKNLHINDTTKILNFHSHCMLPSNYIVQVDQKH